MLEKNIGGNWALVASSDRGSRESDLRKIIVNYLGFDKRTFFNVIYAPQKHFVQLVRGGIEVKRDLDTILGISIAQAVADLLSEASKQLEAKLVEEDSLKRLLNDRLLDKERLLNDLRRLSADLIAKKKEREQLTSEIGELESLMQTFNAISNKISAIEDLFIMRQNSLSLRERNLSQLRQILQGYKSIDDVHRDFQTAKNTLDMLLCELSQLEAAINNLKSELSHMEADCGYLSRILEDRREVADKGFCPKCGQLVDPVVIKKELEKLAKALHQRKAELEKKKDELSQAEDKSRRLQSKRLDLEKKLARLEAMLRQVQLIDSELRKLEGALAELEEKLDIETKQVISLIPQVAATCLLDQHAILSLQNIKQLSIDQLRSLRYDIESRTRERQATIRARISSLEREISEKSVFVKRWANDLKKVLKEISEYSNRIRQIEKIKERIKAYALSEDACTSLQELLRNTMLRVLASKTYYWYTMISPDRSYTAVSFDPESYELLVQPAGSSEFYPVKAYTGGGVETIFALSLRLALAEISGVYGPLMFDEPTDAASERTRDCIMEALYKASHRFRQVLLITHHGAGKELAGSIYQVRYDASKRSSIVEMLNRSM
ncbi:MAG: hypothetical protein DRJ33_06320 [Candidatus Methanomethylicota archaeon]|uniref:Zinc-hook domain-containing protein n=1 Tax=Thermoproteota archaeon TaxID=2056631 RepID=A0A497EX10_9CREN|nr:MAG: hypothetical protein DRJ33_06320 [Candidatus Verstraetearchaeota archaeon]